MSRTTPSAPRTPGPRRRPGPPGASARASRPSRRDSRSGPGAPGRRSRPGTPTAADPALAIGEVARRTGLSTATINFYVAQGIIPPPRKLNRTRAAYAPRHVRLLVLVRRMQAIGLSLQYIKGLLAERASDDAGLRKLEQVGSLMPLPRPRTDPDSEPIEPFLPVGRATFLARAKVPAALVARLEAVGVLRPKQPGRYDARDLWLVRHAKALLDDEVDPEVLARGGHLAGLADALAPLIAALARRHGEALRTREVRVRDLYAPFQVLLEYLVDRTLDERHPGWRDVFLALRSPVDDGGP